MHCACPTALPTYPTAKCKFDTPEIYSSSTEVIEIINQCYFLARRLCTENDSVLYLMISGSSAQLSRLLFGPSLMEATSRDYHCLDGKFCNLEVDFMQSLFLLLTPAGLDKSSIKNTISTHQFPVYRAVYQYKCIALPSSIHRALVNNSMKNVTDYSAMHLC